MASIDTQLRELETKLKNKLIAFYNKYIKPFIHKFPTTTLKAQYQEQLSSMLRTAIEESYLTGTKIVGKAIKIQIPEFELFISTTDVTNIATLAAQLSSQFWITVNRLILRENEFIVNQDNELEPKTPFAKDAAMFGIASLVIYDSYNSAIKSKSGIIEGSKVRFETAGDAKVCDASTNKVAPCQPNSNMVFDANDPNIPQPPLHRFCRCRLIPIIQI